MLQMTLNFEAPAGANSLDLTVLLMTRLFAQTVKVRAETVQYDAPQIGLVETTTWVAYIAGSALSSLGAFSVLMDLSAELGQDCIAVKLDGVGTLIGPDAEKWLPFNPEFFVEYYK